MSEVKAWDICFCICLISEVKALDIYDLVCVMFEVKACDIAVFMYDL